MEDHQFKLVENSANHKYSVFMFKPTDSFFNVLNQKLSKNSSAQNIKLVINSENSKGEIIFGNDNKKFAINQQSLDSKNSCDVLLQKANNYSMMGSTAARIQVLANDDIFVQTREKAVKASEEAKKKQTKVLQKNSLTSKLGSKQREPTSTAHYQPPYQSVAASSLDNANQFSLLVKRPLRLRVMHLLAIRAYDTAALVKRLQGEGVTDSELSQIDTFANELGVPVKPGANQLTLNAKFNTDLQLDWPTFGKYEKQIITTLRASTAPKEKDDTGLNKSSNNKRPTSTFISTDSIPVRKKRNMQRMNGKRSKEESSDFEVASNEQQQPPSSKMTSSPVYPNDSCSDVSDLQSSFPVISSKAQRKLYQQIFDRDYKEYRQCYNAVVNTARKFDQLDRRWKELPQDSRERDDIEQEICQCYNECVEDESLQKMRLRHDFLREKLQLIKKRVKDFDSES